MRSFWNIRAHFQGPLVRPWALAGPVLILLICLPILRPLIQPDPRKWSNQEQMTAATVQAIVEQHTLAIDKSVFRDSPAAVHEGGHAYSPFSPVLPIMLAPWYWILMKRGLSYSDDLIFVHYLMTLIGASIPLAICSGILYRLGRMFELRRSLRVLLAFVCIAGGGLIVFGTVMNRFAPAAMLVLMAVSAISHLVVTGHPHRDQGLAFFAGLTAALAACIDAPAGIVALLLPAVLMVMRWSSALRTWSVVAYLVGAAIPLAASSALLRVGAAPPAFVDASRLVVSGAMNGPSLSVAGSSVGETDEEPDAETGAIAQLWIRLSAWIGRGLEGLVGEHGLLSHSPILVVGLLGAVRILHRNWTAATKMLAMVALVGSGVLILLFCAAGPRAMAYGAPWFVAISPLLMMWGGAWLKQRHRAQSWTMVAIMLAFSLVVSAIGITDPMPRKGYSGYSFGQATMRVLKPGSGRGD